MLLRLPTSLHYPITVTELLKQPNDHVERFAPLFSYFYKTTVTEGDNLGNEFQVEKTFPTRFESSVEGTLTRWKIQEGAVISQADVEIAEIEEPCAHSVQFGGMCVNCGRDMTEASYATDKLDSSRAQINMVHNNVSLTVSPDEAARADDEAKRRLLAYRKLSLVVDLDQTIIHATVDPTVADWQRDEENPNYDAVKDVRAFLLKDDMPKTSGCWYYIKLRPGLQEFLENVSKLYELHIYTMGTRAYAKNIADIIDPQHKIFGDRILSRDESGSITAKNLQRLFPVDTKMVVIIDDRADVWKWSPNLIKVTPYDFFVGIGDINSSFLPKKPMPRPSTKAAAIAAPKPTNDTTDNVTNQAFQSDTNGNLHQELSPAEPPKEDDLPAMDEPESPSVSNVSTLDQLVAMGGGDDPGTRQAQTRGQDEALTAQLEERPLLQKQKQLEEQDAALESTAPKEGKGVGNASPSTNDSTDSDKPKHNLLQDYDRELYQLEQSLRDVHTEFFNIYNNQLTAAQGGRLGALRGGQKRKLPTDNSDLDLVPDIKIVLPLVKSRVLGGTVIVLSGVVPLGLDMASSEMAIMARSFGARIDDDVSRSTTHVVAARNRTLKVRKAIKRGRGKIKIVNPQWLTDSVSHWARQDETPYLLDTEEGRSGAADEDDDILSESESPAPSDSDDETDNSLSTKPSKPLLKIATTRTPQSEVDSRESNLEGDLPSEEQWSAINDELADFLGSDADDASEADDADDVDSMASDVSSKISFRGKKRGWQDEEIGGESEDGADGTLKKKRAITKGLTSLSQTTNIDAEEEGGEDGVDEPPDGDPGENEEGEGWSDFGEDLEAEMARAAEEDEQGEG